MNLLCLYDTVPGFFENAWGKCSTAQLAIVKLTAAMSSSVQGICAPGLGSTNLGTFCHGVDVCVVLITVWVVVFEMSDVTIKEDTVGNGLALNAPE
jgi:hypothetical protein